MNKCIDNGRNKYYVVYKLWYTTLRKQYYYKNKPFDLNFQIILRMPISISLLQKETMFKSSVDFVRETCHLFKWYMRKFYYYVFNTFCVKSHLMNIYIVITR